ncbi:MAG: cache domain-containing protein [Lachnospiraceae bacterium]|nr:cache domain-containing protein [Lachnospiraceae bacterium]
MEKKTKGKFSIKTKLLLMVLLPSVILSVTLTYLAAVNIRGGMQEEALHGLEAIAFSLEEIYALADGGEYTMDASGNVMKGDLAVSGNYAIVDEMKEFTGYDFTIFYGDTRVTTSLKDATTGNRLVGTQASEKVIQAVLNNGEEYSDTNVVINNSPYYGHYVPIKQGGKVIGMAFAGLPQEEADAFIQKKVSMIIGISVTVLAVILVISISFAVAMGNAISGAEKVIAEIGTGNLKVSVNAKAKKRNDELGAMTRELEALVSKLVEVIGNVKQSSKVLYDSGTALEEMAVQSNNATAEIGHAVEDISRGAMTQAEETETASANIVQMGDIITEIVASVDNLGQASMEMKKASDESEVIIEELSISNDRTTAAIEKIGEQVYTTNDSVQAIRQAIELITNIAAETNLLSLNASIEAARAGEHGRGFAVVASQIQKLAEESNTSAQEIGRIIEHLLKDSEQTVKVMNEVNVIIMEQRQKLEETRSKFVLVAQGVESTTNEAKVIEKQTTDCDAARGKIMDVIQNLSAISEENAASTQETNASTEELGATLELLTGSAKDLLKLSTELEESMQFFKM